MNLYSLRNKYKNSKVETDKLSEIYDKKSNYKYESHEKKQVNRSVPKNNRHIGFCIRTGIEIPFNVNKPMCYDAYKSWNMYADPDYNERFCHYSGEKSNGKTSVNKPILRKYWKEAQKFIK